MLRALGAEINGVVGTSAALLARQRGAWEQIIEPVIVLDPSLQPRIDIRLPLTAAARLEFLCRLEGGAEQEWAVAWESGAPLERAQLGATAYERKRFILPGALPLGYHQLTLSTGGARVTSLLIVPPARAFAPPGPPEWGVFTPLYAVRSARDSGAGDLQDLHELTGWTAARGGRVVGTTPLLATFDAEPVEPSPYSPVSKLFWNEMYLDLDAVLREGGGQLTGEQAEALATLKQADLIDYSALMHLRRSVLEPMTRAFFAGPAARREEFEEYVAAHPLLPEYARFRALHDQFGDVWPRVAPRYREHGSPDAHHQPVQTYHLFVQWLLHRQLQKTRAEAGAQGVSLYFDLPVGVRRDGFDPWYEHALFATGASVGAPPDAGFPTGQNWELPPLIPDASRQQGHRYFRASIRHQLTVASMLRIDHVMGLHRLFWIPPGGDSSDGVYVRYPAEEHYAILKLESHRHQATIVGEDLGIVPREVRSAMGRHGLQRLFVLQLELLQPPGGLGMRSPAQKDEIVDPPRSAIASLNTHDMPPFAAFFTRPDGHELWTRLVSYLRDQGLIEGDDPGLEDVLTAAYRFLGRSPARVVLANLEDLWLETAPQNVPGPDVGNPNWRRKLRHSLEELDDLTRARELLELLAQARPEVG